MTAKIFIECPECGFSAKVAADAVGHRATCPECRSKFVIQSLAPEPEPSQWFSPDCPVCPDERLELPDSELGLVECKSCRGGFLPTPGVELLVRDGLRLDPKILSELETFTKAKPIACPSCSAGLTLITLKGVSVDWCPACRGIWLDGGELHRLSGGRWGEPLPERGLFDSLDSAARMAIDKLNEFREYKLQQDTEMGFSTVLFDWDRSNWYDIRGPLGTVAVVAEERRGLLDDLIRNLTEHQARKFYVFNKYSTQVLLELKRSWFILVSSMEVTLPENGRSVGRVQRILNPIIRKYELSDATGEVFAYIRKPIWRFWTFYIQDSSGGEQLGFIRKRWIGWFNEYFSRGDNFVIDFGVHEWTLEERCILLAAAVAIDLDSFEGRGTD